MILKVETLQPYYLLHLDEPYQDKPTVCTWMANTTQICKILFNANSYQVQTYIQVKQVIKDGKFKIATS